MTSRSTNSRTCISLQARRRGGAALLLALLVVVALSLGGAGAMRRSANGALASAQDIFDEQARWLAHDAEALAIRWLEHLEQAPEPLVGDGVHEVINIEREGLRVRVGVIDLSGLLRADRLDTFAATGLPEPVRSLRLEPLQANDPPWLHEELVDRALHARPGASIRAFPASTWSDSESAPSLALWITTRGSGAININTAPAELLRAVFRGRDVHAAQEALDARARGLQPSPDALARLSAPFPGSSAASREPGLTTASDHYGFLVEISERGRGARWWLLAERGVRPPETHREATPFEAPPSPDQTTWRIVESRRIDP